MEQITPSPLPACIRKQATQPKVAGLLAEWPALTGDVTNEALTIQAIPAPTFKEQARAEAIRSRFDSLGLQDVHQDEAGNVIGRTPGTNPLLPALMISAHLDTVFPLDTNLTTYHDTAARRIIGPGLGDNSMGLAAMFTLAKQITSRSIVPACDIWWTATVGEEGLGDLRGMRCLCQSLAEKLGLVIVIEGLGLGHIYHAGLGVRRLSIEIAGPGGHSWLHHDRPSAIHHLLKLGTELLDRLSRLTHSGATFNIGLISGGTSINTRAPQASLAIDLRATNDQILAHMENSVMDVVDAIPRPAELEIDTEVIGNRPSATLSPTHPLVQAAQGVIEYIDWGPSAIDVGSTDANIPLAMGIPSVCIGITTGGNAHSIKEYIDTAPIASGMQQLTLLALLASEHTKDWQDWHCSSTL
ncbi:MAG: M20/M25/M40 family metallo-hydrolase [Anaerolineae bacterium]|nr:M20/M25/M40 family metallo-hydrolase [Anaerolineae bacterium]